MKIRPIVLFAAVAGISAGLSPVRAGEYSSVLPSEFLSERSAVGAAVEAKRRATTLAEFQSAVAKDASRFDPALYRYLAMKSIRDALARLPDAPVTAKSGNLLIRAMAASVRQLESTDKDEFTGPWTDENNYCKNTIGFNREIMRGLTDKSVTPAQIRRWHWGIPCGTGAGEFNGLCSVANAVALAQQGDAKRMLDAVLAMPGCLSGEASAEAGVIAMETSRRATLRLLEQKTGADLDAEFLGGMIAGESGREFRVSSSLSAGDEPGLLCAKGGDEVAEAFLAILDMKTPPIAPEGLVRALAHLCRPEPEGYVEVAVEYSKGGCDIRTSERKSVKTDAVSFGGGMYFSSHPPAVQPLCVTMSVPPERSLSPEVEKRVLARLEKMSRDSATSLAEVAGKELRRLARTPVPKVEERAGGE